jgi:hypothetical protein
MPSSPYSIVTELEPPPFLQGLFEVVEVPANGLPKIKPRFFDRTDDTWQIIERHNEWELDADSVELTVEVGDKITAWWNGQRLAWIPVVTSVSVVLVTGLLKEPLKPGCWNDPSFTKFRPLIFDIETCKYEEGDEEDEEQVCNHWTASTDEPDVLAVARRVGDKLVLIQVDCVPCN